MNPLKVAAALSWLFAAHAAVNAGLLRRPTGAAPNAPIARVSALVPARDEQANIAACLRALLEQTGVDLEVLVYDDGSSDLTASIVRTVAAGSPRVRLLAGDPAPPPGWLGKPHACARLAAAARSSSSVLVFVDADVTLAPDAIAAAVGLLAERGLDLVSPIPRQLATGPAERLLQPLLLWSILATLPLRAAEHSGRESLSAAVGQFLVVRRDAYEGCGGHAGIRADVLDDLALLRGIKRAGGRGVVVNGRDIARCRMYTGWPEVRDGYERWLWRAFGSPAGALAVVAAAYGVFVVPAVAALRGSVPGAVAVVGGVVGRLISARAGGSPLWPDALAHPVSVAVFGWLTVRSLGRHRAGRLAWKGRQLPARCPTAT